MKKLLKPLFCILLFAGLATFICPTETNAQEVSDQPLEVGSTAPDFTLPDLDGNDISLSSLRGKWVMLDFWSSWCGWCMIGVPQMKENYEKFKKECYFVGIDCVEPEDEWKSAVEKNGMNWIQLYNKPKEGKPVNELYGVKGYPTKLLIDPDGKIAHICIGENPDFYTVIGQIIGID